MIEIYNNCKNSAQEFGFGYNLVAGANIAGFVKVADAMFSQGSY
jgi:glutamate dehydrogenase (NADP+)